MIRRRPSVRSVAVPGADRARDRPGLARLGDDRCPRHGGGNGAWGRGGAPARPARPPTCDPRRGGRHPRRRRRSRATGDAHRGAAVRPRADRRGQWRRQVDDDARAPHRAHPARAARHRDRHEGLPRVRWPARARRPGSGSAVCRLDARRPRALESAAARQRDRAEGQADRERAVHRAALPAGRRALCADHDPGAPRASSRARADVRRGRRPDGPSAARRAHTGLPRERAEHIQAASRR